ncbi:uncharacterized protein LOC113229315 [Hyposmocoma kahamanoa]|uniref:uncharacterized protein LOC113229315 n=1 Tax=Hyposmocoma kahamanoa TaxID=1477025 RepID=UPI000E6D9CE5|nr:uncharacterized protein LOC113229315 [Hyposmocoma kahamanoa]
MSLGLVLRIHKYVPAKRPKVANQSQAELLPYQPDGIDTSSRRRRAARRRRACRDVKKPIATRIGSETRGSHSGSHMRSGQPVHCTYNNAFRMLLGLPRFCSASDMFAETATDGFHAILRKRTASLLSCVDHLTAS